MRLFRKKELIFYTSIDDLIIERWFAIQKTNDISYLLKKRRLINEQEQKVLAEAFNVIWKEFIDTFGVSDSMRQVLELRRDIIVETCDMHLHKDRSRLTFINIKKAELEELITSQQGAQFDNTKGYVDKFMGFRIDPKEVVVKDYYGYVKMLEEHVNQNKQHTEDVGQD